MSHKDPREDSVLQGIIEAITPPVFKKSIHGDQIYTEDGKIRVYPRIYTYLGKQILRVYDARFELCDPELIAKARQYLELIASQRD